MKGSNNLVLVLLALLAFVNLFLGVIPSMIFILLVIFVQLFVLNRYESAFIFSLFYHTIGTFFAMYGFRGVGTLVMIVSFMIIFRDSGNLLKKFISALVPLLIIFILLVFSSLFSYGGDYSTEKVSNTILNGILMAFTYAYFLHYNYKFNTYFLSIFTLIYVLFAFKYSIDYYGSSNLISLLDFGYFRTLISENQTSYLEIKINYQTMGFMGVLGLSFMLFDNFPKSKSFSLSVFFIYVLSIFIVLYSGSRQAMLTIVIVTFFYIIKKQGHNWNWRKYVYLGLFFLFVGYFFLQSNIWFIANLRSGNNIIEATGRSELLNEGLHQFSTNMFFGVGYGRYINPDNDYGGSPHNIFIELLSETGIFGVSVFLFLLTAYVFRYYRFFSINSRYMFGIFCIVVTYLVRSLVSADLSYNIVLFSLVFMISLFRPKNPLQQNSN